LSWPFEITALTWLAIAFIAAVLEISIPHFGSAFVSAGAVAAAAVSFAGYAIEAQFITFVVVLTVSLITLRSGLVARLAGRGVPSRTDPLIGRHGRVTHDIDPVLGTGRITIAGEDWAARSREAITAGTKVKVVAADGIVLEVVRE
jgi:membrane protein implicated in regulation of membrane protease activity